MRSLKFLVPAGVAMLVLAGCSTEEEAPPAPETTSSSTSSSAGTSTSEAEEPEAAVASNTIVDVDEADFTPSNASSIRQFILADGTTQCVYSGVGLSCQANIVDAPMVEGADGQPTPANSVAFAGDSVTYQSLTFPGGAEAPRVLAPNERLSSFGYSCTATGDSSLTCDGPEGSASIDNGLVSGATVPPMPESDEAGADAGADEEDGASGAVDELRDLFRGN